MPKSRVSNDGDTVIIKKYANRRLYNTESSSYITLEHLAAMTRDGRDFKVLDARTDEDITHSILTQIIMDEEARGETMLPVNFLRQLIAMYGDNMQSMVPQYLEASMDAFRRNQAQFHDAMKGAFSGGPFADLARRNMAMFEAATSAFAPQTGRSADKDAASADQAGKSTDGGPDEVAALKAQLAALQAKIDKLG
ncbi:polyhydroxyalkanoate synthesis repressor PhaR [Sphingomonas jejuensis]|uniref:Polyhydroxyalkanoate synthesis repressor PhaR n=1 Tax=Sphingomonas jejuensis TaxID=904715 RepID=A0ABX0XKZ8_9SPHN|nr:polyhydroxyalkanoate synthesis repressor PhaR [Sphingomonas jejuensis]NJC34033.1 polyhydroxyalkanoate synthesis repressor PhaR [Sphingomonas jejuensis]